MKLYIVWNKKRNKKVFETIFRAEAETYTKNNKDLIIKSHRGKGKIKEVNN